MIPVSDWNTNPTQLQDPAANTLAVIFTVLLLLAFACASPKARAEHSYDEIKIMVDGKTAAEVKEILGEPDTIQKLLDLDEKWIWWNYTYLDGSNYPPEDRGKVVHLEILFRHSSSIFPNSNSPKESRVDGEFAVSYELPGMEKTIHF